MKQTAAQGGLDRRGELADRNCRASSAMVERLELLERRFHPHHRGAPPPRRRRRSGGAWRANGDIYLDKYAGWYSVRDEAYYDERRDASRRARGARRPRKRHAGRMGRGGELFLPALRLPGQAARALRRAIPDFVLPKERLQRGRELRQGGLQDLSISRTTFDWGIPVPGDAEARHVCLGRRADQLHHRRRLSRHRQRASSGATGRPMCTSSARTSCASTRSTGRPS